MGGALEKSVTTIADPSASGEPLSLAADKRTESVSTSPTPPHRCPCPPHRFSTDLGQL